MKHALCAFVLATMGSTSAYGEHQIAESCSGTETIQVGDEAPTTAPYTLTFSADLAAGYYCFAECKPEQTYRIKHRASNPIKLTDMISGLQRRQITFDRKTAVLTDRQVLTVLGTVKRDAKAACRPAIFHKPTPLPGE